MTAKKYPVVVVVVSPPLSLISSATKFSLVVWFNNLGEIRQYGSGTMDALLSALEKALITEKNRQTGSVTAFLPNRVIEAYAVTASFLASVFYLNEKSGTYSFMLDGLMAKIFPPTFFRGINHEKCISASQVHRRVKSSLSR